MDTKTSPARFGNDIYYEVSIGTCHDCGEGPACTHLAADEPCEETGGLDEIHLCSKCMEKRFGDKFEQRRRFEQISPMSSHPRYARMRSLGLADSI